MNVNWLILVKDFWLIACIIGNVYQLVQISELFFRYDVVTIVSIQYPSSFETSAFTICLYTVDIVKWPEAMEERPQLKDLLEAENVSLEDIEPAVKVLDHDKKVKYDSVLVNGWNISRLFQATLDQNDIFFNCTFLSNETYLTSLYPNCSQVFRIRPFFKEYFKCFTFNSINRTQYDYLTTTRVIGMNGYVNSIKIRDEIVKNRSEDSLVFYSTPGTLPRSSSSVVVTPLNQTIQLTVDNYKSDLLPAPYESDCFDYTQLGLTGDDHCYDCCARNESVRVFNGSVFPGPSLTRRCLSKMISVDSIIQSGKSTGNNSTGSNSTGSDSTQNLNQMMLDIERKCRDICRSPHCEKEIVVPFIMSTNSANDNIFINNVALTPDILAVFIPTLDIIEYFTQISSTFGVWTGLSFFSLCDLLVFLKGKMGRKESVHVVVSKEKRKESVHVVVSKEKRQESVHDAVSKEKRRFDPVQIQMKASGRNALPRRSVLLSGARPVLLRSSRRICVEDIPDTRHSPIIPEHTPIIPGHTFIIPEHTPIIPGLKNCIWYPGERTVFEIGSGRRRLSVLSIESTIKRLLSLNSKNVRTRNGMITMNRTVGHHFHYH